MNDREMAAPTPTDVDLARTGSSAFRVNPRPVERQVVFLMLAGGIVIATSLASIGILTGEFGEALGKAFGAAAACFAYGFLALTGTHRIGQRQSATLAKASVVASVFGLATGILAIWAGDSAALGKLATLGFIAAFATAHASFLQARRRGIDHGVVRTLVTATQVFVAIAATMLCVLVVIMEDAGVGFGRMLAVLLLIDMMFNVLVPIVRRAVRITASTGRPVDHGSAGVFA